MKKILTAGILAVFALTGCSSVENPVAPAPAEVSSVDEEAEYLYDVDTLATPILEATTDSDLIRVGRSICTAIDNGADFEDILIVGLDSGYKIEDLQVLVPASLVNFCPENRGILDTDSQT